MDDDLRSAPSGIVIEALCREDGKNSLIRVYPDRIEWIKEESISSLPRLKSQPPVIPLRTVTSVRARKDGPLFSKLVLRTGEATLSFRMYSPQAVQMRDVIAGLVAAEPPEVAVAVGGPATVGPAVAAPNADELRQLEELRDEGLLSPEQFEAAKAQLGSG